MRAHRTPRLANDRLWRMSAGRVLVTIAAVLSVFALWLALGVSDAATTTDAVTIDAKLARDLGVAAKSCPTLTPARLAGQVMATTGFKPTPASGIAGLTAAQWR